MKIIRGRLSAADVSNPALRYNSDCDCVQQSPDGGATWVNVPDADPRHAAGFLKPPVAGSNKQCDAAANKVKWLHDFIDALIGILTIGGLAAGALNVALDFIDLLFPGAVLLELLIELADTIFGVGAAALSAAFTSDQYDLLECIFFCRSNADGSVSAGQLAQIESDVTAQLNATAALVVNAILFVQGEIGLSNAGAIGSQTGDCSGCACAWCHQADFTLIDDGFTVTSGEEGSWVSGQGWVGAEFNGNSNTECVIEHTFTATPISYVAMHYDKSAASGSNNVALIRLFNGASVVWTGISANTAGLNQFYAQDVPNVTADKVQIIINAGNSGGATAVKDWHIEGFDDNPFGANNC